MRLITAHRILIVVGIVFFALYALWQLRHWLGGDGPTALVQAVVSAAVAVAFVFYYRGLARRWGP